MSKIIEYRELFHTQVTAYCSDGSTVYGFWSDWISDVDNEPDGECIIVDRPNGGGPCSISVDVIVRIEAA